jgi:translation initiation factor 5B
VREVGAASGVRIVAQGCEDAVAGSLLLSENVEDAEKKITEDFQHVKIETQGAGIVLKADALGSLEAIAGLIKDHKIPIRLADIGKVSRKDVIEAESARNIDPFTSTIIAFHVKVLPEAEKLASDKKIKVIQGKIIYKLLEEYEEWVISRKEEEKKKQLEKLVRGIKFKILPGYVFRQSKPAVVGVEIQAGTLKHGIELMNENGKVIGKVKGIQDQGENISQATKGMSVAVSIDGPTVGRQINEKDILFSVMNEPNYKKLLEFKEFLEHDEIEVLDEIKKIMRQSKRKTWGM